MTILFNREHLLRLWEETRDPTLIANHLRANALSLIQEAGGGHVGSSFSAMDIALAVHLFEQESVFPTATSSKYRLFSSKGHDAPALYAINHLLGLIPDDAMRLRRLGYLPGHPEIGSGGTITNTGSLGMGISKAKGFAAADYLRGLDSTTYVILGDGELQEGQIWESIADSTKVLGKVVAIVDGNSIQSDTWVNRTRDLGDVKSRVEACGWVYLETNGHDYLELSKTLFDALNTSSPVFIWAHTQKGKGSTDLEEFPLDGAFYHHHSGALSQALAQRVFDDLLGPGKDNPLELLDYKTSPKANIQSFANSWAFLLKREMTADPDLVVLDADLALDTGTYGVAATAGSRYMQMGISEQDMVSFAGTLALSGFIPVVHSFATFLTMRPYEQIVNNASEKSKVIYVGFLAGLVPSAAGFSHQAVLDLSIMSAVPGMKIFEPATEQEMLTAFQCAKSHSGPTYLRMNSVDPVTDYGKFVSNEAELGTVFGNGRDFTILCSGAFSLRNSLIASQELAKQGLHGSVRTVVNKKSDVGEMLSLENLTGPVLILENGAWYQGTFSKIEEELRAKGVVVMKIALQGFPVGGQAEEVSRHHGFDAHSIAARIASMLAR